VLRGLGEPEPLLLLLLPELPLLIGACAGVVGSSSGTTTLRRDDLELRGASWVSELEARSSRREEDLDEERDEDLDASGAEPSAWRREASRSFLRLLRDEAFAGSFWLLEPLLEPEPRDELFELLRDERCCFGAIRVVSQ